MGDEGNSSPMPMLGSTRSTLPTASRGVIRVACWAHVRCKFHDVYAAKQSPMAQEALERIVALYAVEKAIRGRTPDERHHIR